MNIARHPALLDQLAAAYALGTLRGAARRRFEAYARDYAPVRAAALVWQSRLCSLTELQPGVAPAAAVWTRIHNLVLADKAQSALQQARATPAQTRPSLARGMAWLHSVLFWRTATALGLAAVAFTVGWGWMEQTRLSGEVAQLQGQLQNVPSATAMAVLTDTQASATLLATIDTMRDAQAPLTPTTTQRITLQRLGSYQEAPDRSLQLWALPAGGAPRSLGVLMRDGSTTVTVPAQVLQGVHTLAVSLEPLGGVPSATGPTGPVLFQGALVQRKA
jgi:anti-sigma-K factor RskA